MTGPARNRRVPEGESGNSPEPKKPHHSRVENVENLCCAAAVDHLGHALSARDHALCIAIAHALLPRIIDCEDRVLTLRTQLCHAVAPGN